MNYKFGFLAMVLGTIVLGSTPFALSQLDPDENAYMEIDMLAGQTENPFRIQDENNNNVLSITPQGGFDPEPVIRFTTQMDTEIMDEIIPLWHYSEPATLISQTSESGTGVYQFTYTVTAQDVDETVDSRGMFITKQWSPYIMVEAENIGAGTITANWSVWDATNNIEIMADVTNGVVETGNFAKGYYADQFTINRPDIANYDSWEFEEGETIGLKFWTNTPNDLRINKIAIMGLPNLEVSALSVSIKDMQESDLGNNYDESEVPSCPFSAPTNCFDDTGANSMWLSGWQVGSNLFSLGGDEYVMPIGSYWYGDMFQGSFPDSASRDFSLPNYLTLGHYPDAINVVRWR